jgi:hypothetical protein
MRDAHNNLVGWSRYPMLVPGICCAAFVLLLSSCSAPLPVQREAQKGDESVPEVHYSIVCIIHGDGDYLYHDTDGNEFTADDEALAAARKVALQNPLAEVFIFHQRTKEHYMFLFPRHDGAFYYYRNGRLVAQEKYWRDEEQSRFDTEAAVYRRFRTDSQRGVVSMFLYFGHEIPEFGGQCYDASYPERTLTVPEFADGVKKFAPASSRFDLLLLSTCYGGTPYTIGALGTSARYIVASPGNLHLSYVDLDLLERLDLTMRDGDVHGFAKRFAQHAFEKLTRTIETAVSLAVYDVDRVQNYVCLVQRSYAHTVSVLEKDTRASAASFGHGDCADNPEYVLPSMNDGVDVFFQPARFGRSTHKQKHSGWVCWVRD